jgi:N-acetyl-alpha-D-glucosaminyl L-malate synthase BshA
MRIGIMCHSSYGGSGRIGLELAQELARRGHRVHLFTHTIPSGCLSPEAGVSVHCLDGNGGHLSRLYLHWTDDELKALTARVLGMIATEGLDLLHFHYALPFALVAANLKSRLQAVAPLLVGTLHGSDVSLYGRHPAWRSRLSHILRSLDGLTTVSFSHARLAAWVFRLSHPPVVIPNFVDLSCFRPAGANGNCRLNRPSPQNGRAKIIHVSNFRAVKDPLSMAAIFLGLRHRLEAELWLVGDGPELQMTQASLRRYGLERDVCVFGLTPQVAPLLQEADLLLMSSRNESFCLAALEAMACGVPVLASRVGGLPEVVIHGHTGLLYPWGATAQAADLAAGLLAEPGRHSEMSRNAAGHALNFGHANIVTAYEDFYRTLLARRQKGRGQNHFSFLRDRG